MTEDAGKVLSGPHIYRLTVPPGGTPADSFWSISLYELMPDGPRFFGRNPIERYSVGDRTPGLHPSGESRGGHQLGALAARAVCTYLAGLLSV